MRDLTEIAEDVLNPRCLCCDGGPMRARRLANDVPDLLAALAQARSIAVRLEQEAAANVAPF